MRKSTQQSTLAMADSKERYIAYLASVPVEGESESEGRREARCTPKRVVRTRTLLMSLAHVGLIGGMKWAGCDGTAFSQTNC
jgi:hypothetical protein